MKQHTLARSCEFAGYGLHTGGLVHISVNPAPPDFGVTFVRTDAARRPVLATFFNARTSERCTVLEENDVEILTCEHLLSALSGLGIDNASISIDAPELPVLDGSAAEYAAAFLEAGIKEQDTDREYITIDEAFEYECESGAKYRFEPSDTFSVDVEVDYPSSVVGHQTAHFEEGMDYAAEIAPCRTFCFFNEIRPLLEKGLIKGGSLENALVVVDGEPLPEEVGKLREAFGLGDLEIKAESYLSSEPLKFDNEIARHKLLDLMGDLSLAAMPLKMKVTAFKPGHASNAEVVNALVSSTFTEFDEEDE